MSGDAYREWCPVDQNTPHVMKPTPESSPLCALCRSTLNGGNHVDVATPDVHKATRPPQPR